MHIIFCLLVCLCGMSVWECDIFWDVIDMNVAGKV